MIKENIEKIWERIEFSAKRSGRTKEAIQLVAVTKTVGVEQILETVRCGIQNIGESRIQESLDKYQAIHGPFPSVQWHMIGALQRNKVNHAVELFDLIQSVDSQKLLSAIDRRASELGKVQNCLIEIKVSEEPTKGGLPPEELENILDFSRTMTQVRVLGLMTLAPNFDDRERARPYFAKARKLFEKHFVGTISNPVLSMGMSADFDIAIEEGSTMIRIGSAIFGERPKKI